MKMIITKYKTNMKTMNTKNLLVYGLTGLLIACNSYEDEYQDALEEIKALESNIDDLKNKIKQLNSQTEQDTQRINELTEELNKQIALVDVISTQLSTLEGDNKELQRQLDDANALLEEKREQVNDLREEIDELNNQLANAPTQDEVDALEEKIKELENELAEVEAEVVEVVEEVEVIVTEVVTETEIVVETEVVTNVITEVVTNVITDVVTNVVQVEVTPLTFVGDGGLKLYSDETLEDNNFVTYNLFKTASSTFIDLSDIKDMISVDTDLAYTIQVVDPIADDNKLSVRITFTSGNPTEGIITASISGAYYETTETNENNDEESEDEDSETEENNDEVVCDVDKFSTMITTSVSSPSWNEWENIGSPAKADPTEEFTTQNQIRSGVQTTTLTSVKTYLPCSGKASETTVTEYTDDVEEEQTIQVANPDYDESVVEINGYFYDEMIVSSIASVTYTPWSPWVTQGLVDVSNRTRTNFTIQTTAYLGLEGNEPGVANVVENVNVVTTVETKESVVINVHGNYERVDVGGTHGITDFKAGTFDSYTVYLNGNLNTPLLTINLTGNSGSGSSKKNGYTLNYSFEKDAANNYFIDLSVTSDVNIHVVLNN